MPQIKVYTTALCTYCRAEKAFLHENHIDFEEVAVDTNPAAQHEMIALSGQLGVPFTVITKDDGTRLGILGFDQPRLKQELGI